MKIKKAKKSLFAIFLNLKNYILQFSITNSKRRGFTLVEVIVAMTILSISLVMVMQLFSGGLKSSKTSCDYTRAVLHAKEKMEELFLNPVRDSGKFDDGFEWDSSVEPSQIINLDYEDSGLNLLNIKVNIAWFDTSQRKKSIELVSLKTVVESENE